MAAIDQILLIDNHQEGNSVKLTKLNRSGITSKVKVAVNAGIALLYLQQENEVLKYRTQIIILNVDTPIMNGIDFINEFNKSKFINKDNCMIVVIKDNLTAAQLDQLSLFGIDEFIDEDFSTQDLHILVDQYFMYSQSNLLAKQKRTEHAILSGLDAA